jgi:hypothetical protein
MFSANDPGSSPSLSSDCCFDFMPNDPSYFANTLSCVLEDVLSQRLRLEVSQRLAMFYAAGKFKKIRRQSWLRYSCKN